MAAPQSQQQQQQHMVEIKRASGVHAEKHICKIKDESRGRLLGYAALVEQEV